ncbi:TIGR03767 family metallophosphoesterase, partial [Streptomyces hyaluromycini]
MSRIRSVATSAAHKGREALEINRRTVLAAAGAVSLSAGVGLALRPTGSEAAPASPAAAEEQQPVAEGRQAAAAPLAPYTKGT